MPWLFAAVHTCHPGSLLLETPVLRGIKQFADSCESDNNPEKKSANKSKQKGSRGYFAILHID